MSSRSFFVFGHQLAVCSRCTGIYFGFLFSTLLFFVLIKMRKIPNISPRFLYLAIVILIVDFSFGFTEIGNTLFSRFVTGFFTGAVALFFVLPVLLSWSRFSSRKTNVKNGE
jgi:uncharacterized membrane protein